jgi:hypothetical protein
MNLRSPGRLAPYVTSAFPINNGLPTFICLVFHKTFRSLLSHIFISIRNNITGNEYLSSTIPRVLTLNFQSTVVYRPFVLAALCSASADDRVSPLRYLIGVLKEELTDGVDWQVV